MKMNQQDNFSSGFLLGSVVGGILGGVVGALLVSRRDLDALSQLSDAERVPRRSRGNEGPEALPRKPSRRKLHSPDEYRMEAARQGLDEKIAQLNEAIDDVRLQLGHVNANGKGGHERSGRPTNGEVF